MQLDPNAIENERSDCNQVEKELALFLHRYQSVYKETDSLLRRINELGVASYANGDYLGAEIITISGIGFVIDI
jgi:hypothetical protein